MLFADKLAKQKRRKQCVVVLEAQCLVCEKTTDAVFHEDESVTAPCCDAPDFDPDIKPSGFTLRDMTGKMRDFYELDGRKRVRFKGQNPDLNTLDSSGRRALTVAMVLVNDETKEIHYDYKKKEDLAEISDWGNARLEPLLDAALDLCGLAEEAKEEASKKPESEEASTPG